MIKTSIFSLILFLNFSSAIANTSQYFCTGDANQFFLNLNRICYVWHEEDENLKKLGYNQDVPKIDDIESNIFGRYLISGIEHIETRFKTGNELFKKLKTYRKDFLGIEEIINLVKKQ